MFDTQIVDEPNLLHNVLQEKERRYATDSPSIFQGRSQLKLLKIGQKGKHTKRKHRG